MGTDRSVHWRSTVERLPQDVGAMGQNGQSPFFARCLVALGKTQAEACATFGFRAAQILVCVPDGWT